VLPTCLRVEKGVDFLLKTQMQLIYN